MVSISTFVFFDIETTGLPMQERNRTKIVELSFVAVSRKDIMRKNVHPNIPSASKLNLLLNPQKTIRSADITGITNEMAKNSPTFKEKFNTIKAFLDDLPRPVCLVAHNGNRFDYKILLAECLDANVKLPEHLLCSDSLTYFRYIYKKYPTTITKVNAQSTPRKELQQKPRRTQTPELTDDEDNYWPEFNVTSEDLKEIDDLCASFTDLTTNPLKVKTPKSYKLTDIYINLLRKEPKNAHRAESDCIMLLECVQVIENSFDASDSFLKWNDNNSKLLTDIKPLIRK